LDEREVTRKFVAGNALVWATEKNHTEVVELLKKAGAKE